jgi:hypothetical protein
VRQGDRDEQASAASFTSTRTALSVALSRVPAISMAATSPMMKDRRQG